MFKWIGFLLIMLLLFLNYNSVYGEDAEKIAICLRDFDTPQDINLDYVVKGINTTIINRLSQFPIIKVYPAQGKYFNEPEKILLSDKVQLLPIRRETGFDGLIFGKVENLETGLRVTMHLIDFSSGRIYFSGTFEENFGSGLLSKLEEKVALYAEALISYYDCILDISSEPAGGEVWVNDEKVGITPINKVDVKDGKTKIQIKKEGYVPYETEIEIKSGQKGSVHAQLYRYSLSATSTPIGASVYLNDRYLGITPIDDLTVDQPEFNVKFSKKGFTTHNESISLKPGDSAFIHAELYDLLVDHIRNKKSSWEIDSHNFGILQTLDIQNIEEIGITAFTSSNFRYQAKFGRLYTGFGMGSGIIKAAQRFDTFLGEDEGYEAFNIDITKSTIFAYYNILEKLGLLEIYLGPTAGFLVIKSSNYNTPFALREIQSVNPLLGGEVGVNFYIARQLKLSFMFGGYYGGDIEYAMKEGTYWGEAKYKNKIAGLHPFYAGASLTFSLWSALIR